MSFVPGTRFYRQKTKYTKPAARLFPTTTFFISIFDKEDRFFDKEDRNPVSVNQLDSKLLKTLPAGFKHSARNRPISRLWFLPASFYEPEPYCIKGGRERFVWEIDKLSWLSPPSNCMVTVVQGTCIPHWYVNRYVHTYTCIDIIIYIYVYIYIYMCVYIYMCICLYAYIYTIYIYVYVYVYVYMCIYICMCKRYFFTFVCVYDSPRSCEPRCQSSLNFTKTPFIPTDSRERAAEMGCSEPIANSVCAPLHHQPSVCESI